MKKITVLFLVSIISVFLVSIDTYAGELLNFKCKSYVGKITYYFTNQPLILNDKIYFVSKGDSSQSDGKDKLYVLSDDCKLLWTFPTGDRITASSTIADIDRDGKPEILFPSDDHNLYCVDSDGKLRWKVSSIEGIMASPVVADLNSDDIPEVIYGNLDSKLVVLNNKGEKIFTYKTGDMIFTTPAVGDLDNNNKIDVIVSIDGYLHLESAIPSGMILWSKWRGDGLGTGTFENSVLFPLTHLLNKV